MSTSIASASSAIGLLDRHYSTPSIRDSPEPILQATGWIEKDVESQESLVAEPEMVTVDPAEVTEPVQVKGPKEPDVQVKAELELPDKPVSHTESLLDDRRDAISGLLAALTTSSVVHPVQTETRLDNVVAGDEQKDAVSSAPVARVTEIARTVPRRTPSAPPDSPISIFTQDEDEESDESFDRANLAVSYGQTNHDTLMSDLEDTGPMVAREILPPPNRQIQISAEDIRAMQIYQEEHPVHLEDFPMHVDYNPEPPRSQREPTPINVKRQYDAFARLEFPDGIFYLNTYSCELGRDAHAYQDALKREKEAKMAIKEEEPQPKISSGKASQRIQSIRAAESQVQRSVVSESGGFAGVDDQPIASYDDKKKSNEKHSSQGSNASLVRPADLHRDPSLVQYDYHKDVVYQPAPNDEDRDYDDDERPAPVTAEHMPDPNSVPLIPIHPTAPAGSSLQSDVTNLKNISRRHIRIAWDWRRTGWFLTVLGRNGAFFQNKHVEKDATVRLYSGACIQVSAVEFVFRLPTTVTEETMEPDDTSSTSSMMETSPTQPGEGQSIKLKLKVNGDVSPSQLASAEMKRRGPGRPPKNGVMSQREMKERERAEKEAKTQTSSSQSAAPQPPALQRKSSKSQLPKPEPDLEAAKQEKRKYTKRKREDGEEEDVVMPSIEPHDPVPQTQTSAAQPTPSAPPPKRARTRSDSPPVPAKESYTEEQLLRPSANYAILLYEILKTTGEISLKRIYREMQIKHPFFAYGVTSDGWTSSIRHNLNAEVDKLFRRVRKDGKGFTWDAIPNALEVYTQNKKQRTNTTVSKPRPPPTQSQNMPANQSTQLQWQNPNTQNGRPANPGAPGRPGGVGPPVLPPSFVPRDEDLHLYLKYPAPPHLPVSFEGLAVIHRFQQTMMKAVSTDAEKEKRWKAIFDSVRARCLRGAPGSILPGGEVPDEAMILEHVQKFCNVYKNPRFTSYNAVPPPIPVQQASVVPPSGSAPGQGAPATTNNNVAAQQAPGTNAQLTAVSTTPVANTTVVQSGNANVPPSTSPALRHPTATSVQTQEGTTGSQTSDSAPTAASAVSGLMTASTSKPSVPLGNAAAAMHSSSVTTTPTQHSHAPSNPINIMPNQAQGGPVINNNLTRPANGLQGPVVVTMSSSTTSHPTTNMAQPRLKDDVNAAPKTQPSVNGPSIPANVSANTPKIINIPQGQSTATKSRQASSQLPVTANNHNGLLKQTSPMISGNSVAPISGHPGIHSTTVSTTVPANTQPFSAKPSTATSLQQSSQVPPQANLTSSSGSVIGAQRSPGLPAVNNVPLTKAAVGSRPAVPLAQAQSVAQRSGTPVQSAPAPAATIQSPRSSQPVVVEPTSQNMQNSTSNSSQIKPTDSMQSQTTQSPPVQQSPTSATPAQQGIRNPSSGVQTLSSVSQPSSVSRNGDSDKLQPSKIVTETKVVHSPNTSAINQKQEALTPSKGGPDIAPKAVSADGVDQTKTAQTAAIPTSIVAQKPSSDIPLKSNTTISSSVEAPTQESAISIFDAPGVVKANTTVSAQMSAAEAAGKDPQKQAEEVVKCSS